MEDGRDVIVGAGGWMSIVLLVFVGWRGHNNKMEINYNFTFYF